jgi:hypothetical protein
MDEAKDFIRDLESFHRRYGLIRPDPKPSAWYRAKQWLRARFHRRPDAPQDPYAYVTARPKPRPPYLRGSATAD